MKLHGQGINYNALYADLMKDEGVRQYVYDDATGKPIVPGSKVVGNPSVGIGRNLSGLGLDESEIKYLFLNDIQRVEQEVRTHFGTLFFNGLSERRKNIILGMVFNMGIARFKGFKKMIEALIRFDYNKAADEILDSKAARDLPSRYERYAERMRHDF